jgi:hypothetical protein
MCQYLTSKCEKHHIFICHDPQKLILCKVLQNHGYPFVGDVFLNKFSTFLANCKNRTNEGLVQNEYVTNSNT